MAVLDGKKVAIIVGTNFEQVELTGPKSDLEEAGATVEIVSPLEGPLQGLNHIDKAETFTRDVDITKADFDTYDAIVLPGGAINADQLRMDDDVQEAVTDFLDSGKPVAVICHAPWVLVSADVLHGRKLTGYYTIQDDIRNAGGEWLDQQVVVDGNLITSRKPDDIPAFSDALITMLKNSEAV
jgi:protease I